MVSKQAVFPHFFVYELSFCIGWREDNEEGTHAVGNDTGQLWEMVVSLDDFVLPSNNGIRYSRAWNLFPVI